jgi:hypothetical protein
MMATTKMDRRLAWPLPDLLLKARQLQWSPQPQPSHARTPAPAARRIVPSIPAQDRSTPNGSTRRLSARRVLRPSHL